MPDATAFTRPSLTAFCRLDELGLVVVGQRLEPKRAVLACREAIELNVKPRIAVEAMMLTLWRG